MAERRRVGGLHVIPTFFLVDSGCFDFVVYFFSDFVECNVVSGRRRLPKAGCALP